MLNQPFLSLKLIRNNLWFRFLFYTYTNMSKHSINLYIILILIIETREH